MPRNGQGIMERLPGSTAEPGETIASAMFNAVVDDVVSGMNGRLPIALGGTNANNIATAAKNMGTVYANDHAGTGTVGGTATAITYTSSRGGYEAWGNSIRFTFKATSNSADSGTTIALDALTAKAAKIRENGVERAIRAGDWYNNDLVDVRYDSTAASGAGALIVLSARGSGGMPFAVLNANYADADVEVAAYEAWTTLPLISEEYDPQNQVTLSANQFVSLKSGWLDSVTVMVTQGVSNVVVNFILYMRLWNVTTSAAVAYAVATRGISNGVNAQAPSIPLTSILSAPINAGDNYRLEYWVRRSNASAAVMLQDTLSQAGATGVNDITTRIVFR